MGFSERQAPVGSCDCQRALLLLGCVFCILAAAGRHPWDCEASVCQLGPRVSGCRAHFPLAEVWTSVGPTALAVERECSPLDIPEPTRLDSGQAQGTQWPTARGKLEKLPEYSGIPSNWASLMSDCGHILNGARVPGN